MENLSLNELLDKEDQLKQDLLSCDECNIDDVSKIKAELNHIDREITTICEC